MLSKVDPDPRQEIEVDPVPERGLKWIRIRNAALDSLLVFNFPITK